VVVRDVRLDTRRSCPRRRRQGSPAAFGSNSAGGPDEAGLTLIQLALAFVTTHPAVTAAIIGPRTAEHLHDQLSAADSVLEPAVLDRIDRIVAPGTNLNPDDAGDSADVLADLKCRRRAVVQGTR
jgi:aryl-alcohol dehydrogenase-like predicted oxidoreductase